MKKDYTSTLDFDNKRDLVHEARMNLLSARYRITTNRK